MSGWDDDKRGQDMRAIPHEEVKSYIDYGMRVQRYDGYDPATQECFKTFVISAGSYDGEYIDLFDLQEWFDKNRTWIDMLRQKVQE